MTTYNAVVDLGWTPGTNVLSQMQSFFSSTASSGDTLYLPSSTRFILPSPPEVQLPTNFTIEAVDGGGFDITQATTNTNTKDYFRLNDNSLILNVTCRAPNAPTTGYTKKDGKRGIHYSYSKVWVASNKDNLTFRNCDFEGQVNHWTRISAGQDLTIEGTRMYGGYWQNYLTGAVYRPVVRDSYFEYAMGDNFKMGAQSAGSPSGWIGPYSDGVTPNFYRCDFVRSNRDAIDTTGGIRDFIFQDCLIVDMIGFDIKTPIKQLGNPKQDIKTAWPVGTLYGNKGIQIIRFYFIDPAPNCIVLTNDNPGGSSTSVSIADYDRVNPQDIEVTDATVEIVNSTANPRLFFMKGGDNVSVDGLTWRNVGGVSQVIFNEDYDAGGSANGDAPAGWSPNTSPTSSNVTTTGSNSNRPEPQWTKVDPVNGGDGPDGSSPPAASYPVLRRNSVFAVSASS